MKPVTQDAIRALAALSVAVLEWDSDESLLQTGARQALENIREATNRWDLARMTMSRISQDKRERARRE